MMTPADNQTPDATSSDTRPCPVALLAADGAILDDHITALWSDPETEGGLCLALDTWRNALTARALALAPTSAAGAAFQAHLIALDITTAAGGAGRVTQGHQGQKYQGQGTSGSDRMPQATNEHRFCGICIL